jgi:hypothetical protein
VPVAHRGGARRAVSADRPVRGARAASDL